ncbi:MAG: hypothetical protein AAGI34_10045 [Pseudomonadota bacterium]
MPLDTQTTLASLTSFSVFRQANGTLIACGRDREGVLQRVPLAPAPAPKPDAQP